MAVKHYQFTVSGASQELTAALGITRGGADDPSFATIAFQAGATNAAPVFIGETGQVISNTNYGLAIINGVSAVVLQAAGGAALRLSDFAIKGTANEELAILGVLR